MDEKKARRREAGTCTQCGSRPALDGKRTCARCLKIARSRYTPVEGAKKGGVRPGAGRPKGSPNKRPAKLHRGLRWDADLLPQLEAWAERHGLDFTAAVHEACRRLLKGEE